MFLRDSPDAVFIQFDTDFPRIRSTGGELQHLYRSDLVNLTSGIGRATTRAPQTLNIGFAPPLDFLNQSTPSEEGNKSSNAYLYANINASKNLSFTLGMSYDKYQPGNTQTSENRSQFNPKLGVTWSPVAGTTLRAAAFRVLTRSLITDQTLEPTQVAGFNQFYDDAGATDSRRYGVAIDQKFSRTLFGGIELGRRDLNIPFRDVQIDAFGNVTSDQVLRGDSKEKGGRAYLFWTPDPRIALSAQYQHERFANQDPVAFSFRNVKTDRLPLGISYFHPLGFGLSLRGTQVRQSGEFRRLATGMFEPGNDSFFLVDAALTYRLPHRHGVISAGVANLTDRRFNYQDTDPGNASIQPRRSAFIRATLAF